MKKLEEMTDLELADCLAGRNDFPPEQRTYLFTAIIKRLSMKHEIEMPRGEELQHLITKMLCGNRPSEMGFVMLGFELGVLYAIEQLDSMKNGGKIDE